MRLLIVEDEERVASFLMTGLKAHGYVVEHVTTGAEALARLREGSPDLIVLDLALPDIDGLRVLRRLRQEKRAVPVIILTARDDVHDLVDGLDFGADDYLTKPFAFEEFLARVRARLRPRPTAGLTVLRAGKLSLDLRTRRASLEGRTVDLAAREFALLETFLRHPGQLLSRKQLLTQAWGPGDKPAEKTIDVYVRSLRRKLGEACIETVRGMGYRLPAG
jgi:two-component system copper resistance phosphate regulon response regulator CusR